MQLQISHGVAQALMVFVELHKQLWSCKVLVELDKCSWSWTSGHGVAQVLVQLDKCSWSCTGARGVGRALLELKESSWSWTSTCGVGRVLIELDKHSWSCMSARGIAQALMELHECSWSYMSGNFLFLLPITPYCKNFKQVWLYKVVFGCPNHFQLESQPHICLPCVSKPTSKITVQWICMSTRTSVTFNFLLPTATQCNKFIQVKLLAKVFRCPHHLQKELWLYLHSLNGK